MRSQDFASHCSDEISTGKLVGSGNLPEARFSINVRSDHFSAWGAYAHSLRQKTPVLHHTAFAINSYTVMGSMQVDESSFSAPSQVHSFDGILLDFDGTIIDSTDAIVKHWHK